MSETLEKSPLAIYREYCESAELAYQAADGKSIFYPRLLAPGTGNTDIEWKISNGIGTVYATTTLYPRDKEPYDISLIELDEGYRMMSRVEGIDPNKVRIGMRVKVRFLASTENQPAYPVFDPVESS